MTTDPATPLTLDLAVCTHRPEGLQRLATMLLPPMSGVRYIVSWQAHGDTPVPAPVALRDDVEIHRFGGTGLAANRNNALEHCHADIVLIADDDVIYTPASLKAVINTFAADPTLDVTTFRSHTPGTHRAYPASATRLRHPYPKGYYACSFEIALRRATAGHLRVHPLLGLGSPWMHAGEDEVLLLTAVKSGLDCRFHPIGLCTHPALSTGQRPPTPAVLRGQGCVIALAWGIQAWLRVPLKAWRVARAYRMAPWAVLRHLAAGALRGPAMLRSMPGYLWDTPAAHSR